MSRIPKRKPKHQTEPNINNDQNEQIPIISNQPLPNNNIENDTNLQNQNPSEIINTNNINNQNNNMNEYNYGERLELMRKMKHRHDADGAVNINVEEDDLQTGNYDLYENKDINLEKPKINENISKENTEYYIESIHHDEFLKIIQQTRKEEESDIDKKKKGIPIKAPIKEKSFQQKIEPQREIKLKKSKRKKPLTSYEMRKLTEKKIFEKFDDELTEIITKTMSKVTLLFLFAQGILAGMGLLHILIMVSMESWENFRKTHGKMVMLMFNIFHTLTFASIIGNGIKFISAYQKYNLIRNKFNKDAITVFTRLKKKMYFSAILLIFFFVTFALEVFLATRVQRLNYIGCVEFIEDSNTDDNSPTYDDIADKDYFGGFKNIHLVVDILVILLFIFNIFDVNVESGDEKIIQPKVEVTYLMGDLNETYDEEDLR